MRDATITEDEIVRETETPNEFERSSQLFYEADKLRYLEQETIAAEKKYREAMDATGDYGVFYHLAQGQIYSMRGNVEYALTEFEIASEIDDRIDSVFINLGLTYRKIAGRLRSLNFTEKADEMIQESIAALKRAVGLNPNSAGAWSALAITYLKMGEKHREDVEQCVLRARELDPQSYMAMTTLANLRRQQGIKPEARQLALDAIPLRPKHADAYGILGAWDGKTKRLEEKPKEAIAWLEKGLERQPNAIYERAPREW